MQYNNLALHSSFLNKFCFFNTSLFICGLIQLYCALKLYIVLILYWTILNADIYIYILSILFTYGGIILETTYNIMQVNKHRRLQPQKWPLTSINTILTQWLMIQWFHKGSVALQYAVLSIFLATQCNCFHLFFVSEMRPILPHITWPLWVGLVVRWTWLTMWALNRLILPVNMQHWSSGRKKKGLPLMLLIRSAL